MKKTLLVTALAMITLMAGCSGGTAGSSLQESSLQDSADVTAGSDVETHATEENSKAPESTSKTSDAHGTVDIQEPAGTSEAPAEFALYGPGGDKIEQSDITRVMASDEEDYKLNGISSDNWIQAEISGTTYLAEPGGEYRRVKVGDEICGLTVFDAGCVFSADNEVQPGEFSNESWFSSGYVEFEGSVTVSGTLSILAEGTDMLEAGSVLFTPDEGTQLPVMNYLFSGEKGVYYDKDNMFPVIVLSDVTPDSDTGHATLTLESITMSSMVNSNSLVRAKATDVEFN